MTSALLFLTVLYEYFTELQFDQLRVQVDLVAQGVEDQGAAYLENLEVSDYRLTWIDADGSVLFDSASDTSTMENHLEREEVQEALTAGYGSSSRYSSTLLTRYLYEAKLLDDGTVMRIGVTQNSLVSLLLGMLLPILIIFVIVLGLSSILASRLSKRIVAPLNELNLDAPLDNEGYDELSPLLRRIDAQQKEIARQSDALRQRRNELEVMTSGMTEGIVLLNVNGDILHINQAAMRLFGADKSCEGENILELNRDVTLSALWRAATSGSHAEDIVTFANRQYNVMASPVLSNDAVSGVVLLLLDVTEKEQAEQMRREFTANVSHELRTPLHTISGSAELLVNDVVKPEDVPAFANRIYTEAQRMIQLVEDIIRLSHLDEGAEDMTFETVNVYEVAEDVLWSLTEKAESAQVSLTLHGDEAFITGIKHLVCEIIYNICDNAIKYNRAGGSVMLDITDTGEAVQVSIADTGIGIPPEYVDRIFERFYRVDKSHSKEIGGTGLGLSIVKHAAKLHNADITVQSVVDQGTTITVAFPKHHETERS